MAQGALGAAVVRRVWAGAGLQRAAYRGGGISCGLGHSLFNFYFLCPIILPLFSHGRPLFAVGLAVAVVVGGLIGVVCGLMLLSCVVLQRRRSLTLHTSLYPVSSNYRQLASVSDIFLSCEFIVNVVRHSLTKLNRLLCPCPHSGALSDDARLTSVCRVHRD